MKYKNFELVGKGSYGFVSKAECISSDKIVALKVMKIKDIKSEYCLTKLIREI